MPGMINLNDEKINADVQSLRGCCEQLKQMQSNLNQDINALREIWTGSAAAAYMECANNMNVAVITPMINLLNAYAEAINNGAYQLSFNDQESAKKTTSEFGGITTISNVI